MPKTSAVAARRWVAPVFASALLILSGCGGGGYGGSSGGGGGGGVVDPGTITPIVTTQVTLSGLTFDPRSIQVSPGATLTFTNNDVGTAHNVVFANASAPTINDFTSGSRTTTAPTTAGTYNFQCTNHPGMTGVVKVQ